MVIVGIDPGFAIVGYGAVLYEGNKFTVLDYGCIYTKANTPFEDRLVTISDGIREVLEKHKPSAIGVEELYFNKNEKTALQVAHGRGVIILTAARMGIQIMEYTPLQVKMAVTGYGRADKAQIQQMTKTILNLEKIPKPDDAADALAVAICLAHSHKMERLLYND